MFTASIMTSGRASDGRAILHTADLICGPTVTAPREGITIHVHPDTGLPGDALGAGVYRELTLAVGEAQASLGYEQIHLPAARVDPASATRDDDHNNVRIVPVGETPVVIRVPRSLAIGHRDAA